MLIMWLRLRDATVGILTLFTEKTQTKKNRSQWTNQTKSISKNKCFKTHTLSQNKIKSKKGRRLRHGRRRVQARAPPDEALAAAGRVDVEAQRRLFLLRLLHRRQPPRAQQAARVARPQHVCVPVSPPAAGGPLSLVASANVLRGRGPPEPPNP